MHLEPQEIEIIQQYFAKKPVLKAYLFGSYSRNEADHQSDVDILVELDYSKHIGLGFVQMKFDLENKLNKRVDLVPADGINQRILPFIEPDKQLIYEAGLLVRFTSWLFMLHIVKLMLARHPCASK